MAKKKTRREGRDTTMLGLRVDAAIWEEFRAYVESLFPRVSATSLLEAAMVEYLARHKKQPEEKK